MHYISLYLAFITCVYVRVLSLYHVKEQHSMHCRTNLKMENKLCPRIDSLRYLILMSFCVCMSIPSFIILSGFIFLQYIKHLAFDTAKHGWDVVVSNHRGLGGVSVTVSFFFLVLCPCTTSFFLLFVAQMLFT